MKLALCGGEAVRTRPFLSWPQFGDEERQSLSQLLQSGTWGGYSPKVKEFEDAFCKFQQVKHGVCCCNGTVALELALRAIGIACGDEVIVPPYTFAATATAVLLCHGCPVFVDIDPITFGLSPTAVEAAITPRTRAIIAVHFGGHPADMDALCAIAESRGIALIEDAAHAHGATWRGIPVGNFGVAATFSFQAFKLITAGEGGIVLTNSSSIADKVWSYCNQGRRRDTGWFEHFTLGSNYRMTGFQAAILCAQLQRLPVQTGVRVKNVQYFRERLRSFRGIFLSDDDTRVGRNPYYLLTLRYDSSFFKGVERDIVIRALQAEGIPAQPSYPHPLYRNRVFHSSQLPPCNCGSWHSQQKYESLCLVEGERICRDGIWLEQNVFAGGHEDVDDVLAAFEKVQVLASSLGDFQQSVENSHI
jgi:dTDP-4-amino-4,6-dideoxygalactose transaminase